MFDEDISGYTGPAVYIDLKADATPRFCKARPVPLALWAAVVDDLNRLECEGIIKPVHHAVGTRKSFIQALLQAWA